MIYEMTDMNIERDGKKDKTMTGFIYYRIISDSNYMR